MVQVHVAPPGGWVPEPINPDRWADNMLKAWKVWDSYAFNYIHAICNVYQKLHNSCNILWIHITSILDLHLKKIKYTEYKIWFTIVWCCYQIWDFTFLAKEHPTLIITSSPNNYDLLSNASILCKTYRLQHITRVSMCKRKPCPFWMLVSI